jgi:phosphoenolpyruvate-protein phosphotransferase
VKSIEAQVRSEAGLHARPAADFVRSASGFRSKVRLENVTLAGQPVDARSLTEILSAGVEKGHRVRVWADGPDEDAALEALAALLGSEGPVGQGDGDRGGGRTAEAGDGLVEGRAARIAGIAGAPGIAVGPIWRPEWELPVPVVPAPEASPEQRLREAAAAASAELGLLAGRLREAGRPGDAGILEAQALMAVDPVLVETAVRLAEAGLEPGAAVLASTEASARAMAGLRDEVLAARAADVRDVGARIARVLAGENVALPGRPSIIAARDVPPSLVAEIPPGLLLGLALEGGTPSSHLVILARGLGIPAVVAAPGLLAALGDAPGDLALDGDSGEIFPDPDRAALEMLEERRRERAARAAQAAALRGRPGATSDGRRVALLANIRSPEDAPRAIASGAEGVGLFRTEYLFLRRRSAPGEEEQVAAYRQAMEAFGPDRSVVIRLVDIGGDKEIPYLGLREEPNPFLGVRAIRLAHGSRELLLAQLRAVWRAAGLAGVTPHVMAAMVSTVADARLLAELRDEARAAVVAAGHSCPERMVTGLMIEVPSAAAMAPELARLADFFSIGTNDLTQYVLAADRGNPSLARLQDALHPAVLRTVAAVLAGARTVGIPVAACGELAGDPAGALVLAGLGVAELSADPASLDGVRAALAGVSSAELGELAEQALAASDAETVRTLADQLLDR